MPDKYHGGVPTDHLRPVRQWVWRKDGFEPPESRSLIERIILGVWLFIYRTLRLWRIRQFFTRRALLRALELRSAHRVSTWQLMVNALRGGERQSRNYDPLDTVQLMALARATGATMMANQGTAVPGLTSIANPSGAFQDTATEAPTQDQTTLALLSDGGGVVVGVPVPTGNATTDQANIQAAVATAAASGFGGTVQLQAGAYAGKSFARTDTVSNAGPGTTWTDASILATDVGSYVVGPDIVGSGGTAGRSPKILTVTPGTGFTTDIAPGAAMAGVSVWVHRPVVVHPEGIKIRGVGGIYAASGATVYWTSTPARFGTAIIDTGSGITIFTRGSNSYGARYGLYDLVVWGGNGNWTGGTGYTGSALVGLYLSNNSWWYQTDNVDFNYYLTAGMAFDGNMNAASINNSSIQHIGTLAATTPTGGVLTSFFTGATSATLGFNNVSIDAIYGMGIASAQSGSPYGSAVNLNGCQVWNCLATSFATYSGYGAVIAATLGYGQSSFVGCWFGTNATGDLWLNNGQLTAINCTFTSNVAAPVRTWANLTLITCNIFSSSANAVTISGSGTLNWMGCGLSGSATNLYSSGPTAAQSLGVGTSIVGGLWSGAGVVTQP